MIVTDDRVAVFVAKACGVVVNPPYTLMGIERGGQIIAGVVFNQFTGPDVHLTVAGHGWTRGVLADIGQYVFRQLGCERMTFVTEQAPVVRLAERLGGKVEGLMRNHFGKDRPGYVVGVLKDDYPW